MRGLIDHILNLPAGVILALVGLLVFAEDAIFVGFVIPGETAAVIGGVAASQGTVNVVPIVIVVVLAAIAGDSVGYEIGRHFGPKLLDLPVLAKHKHRLDDARSFLARRGGAAVFLGRFVAFFRATMPGLAGISGMTYRRFLAFNALGGLVWGTTFSLLGFIAGNSYAKVEKTVGRGAAVVVAGIVLVAIVVWRVRHHRAERRRELAGDDPADATGPARPSGETPVDAPVLDRD